jgi:hypothetical protein
MTGLGKRGVLTVVGRFEFGGRDVILGFMKPRMLNQSTYPRVAISAGSAVRQGPRGLIKLGLEQPGLRFGQRVTGRCQLFQLTSPS